MTKTKVNLSKYFLDSDLTDKESIKDHEEISEKCLELAELLHNKLGSSQTYTNSIFLLQQVNLLAKQDLLSKESTNK